MVGGGKVLQKHGGRQQGKSLGRCRFFRSSARHHFIARTGAPLDESRSRAPVTRKPPGRVKGRHGRQGARGRRGKSEGSVGANRELFKGGGGGDANSRAAWW